MPWRFRPRIGPFVYHSRRRPSTIGALIGLTVALVFLAAWAAALLGR